MQTQDTVPRIHVVINYLCSLQLSGDDWLKTYPFQLKTLGYCSQETPPHKLKMLGCFYKEWGASWSRKLVRDLSHRAEDTEIERRTHSTQGLSLGLTGALVEFARLCNIPFAQSGSLSNGRAHSIYIVAWEDGVQKDASVIQQEIDVKGIFIFNLRDLKK